MQEIGLDTQGPLGNLSNMMSADFDHLAGIRASLEALSHLPLTCDDWVLFTKVEDGRHLIQGGGAQENLVHLIRRLEPLWAGEMDRSQAGSVRVTERYRLTVRISNEQLGQQVQLIFHANGGR